MHFEDGTSSEFDAIVYATGYNITFPFFDEEFLSAPGNQIRLFKRMFKPGTDDLVLMGFAQAVPTLFPFVEAQARLLAAYAVGRYALPDVDEMERVIDEDHAEVPRPRDRQAAAHPAGRLLRLRARPAGQGDPGRPGPRGALGQEAPA